MNDLRLEIAQAAAALVVEEGLESGAAKNRAVRQLALPRGTPLPDRQMMDAAIKEYIDLFRAEEQPLELLALRRLALTWMERLAGFRPLLGGAVWRGTATAHSVIHLQLFAEDIKALPIWLLDHQIRFDTREAPGLGGRMTEAMLIEPGQAEAALEHPPMLCLWNNPAEALHGALLPQRDGETLRGDAQALRTRMAEAPAA